MSKRLDKFRQALRKQIQAIKGSENKVARVGVVENQHYPDTNIPVAYVAAIQEYGSPSQNIPPRPFFRPTIANQQGNWAKIAKYLFQQGKTSEQVLEAVGLRAAADIQETISEITAPPLSLATKKARNRKAMKSKAKAVSIKPLVDSGLLIASINSVVADRGTE